MTGLLLAAFAAWFLSGFFAALFVARCIPPSLDDISEIELPSGHREHFADQRLERRGFGEGGSVHHHGKDI